MAKLNLSFYQNEDGYSDGAMEDELLTLFKNGQSKEKFLQEDCRWPSLYHLSDFRENILSWYPFNPEASLLEVGAGCGALTGLFCRKVRKVTSVELTKRRSSVNYERNKDCDNLEIISGNFHNIAFTEKYDYIILNGVLEYAASFTKTENPYTDFLKQLKALLKPDGVILIAIENRLGMKYLNGAPEDHTSSLFSGLNNYRGIDFVRTFSRNELQDLVREAGFEYQKLYYPAPDYKFPTAVFTDQTLDMADSSLHDYSFNANRLVLFSEHEFEQVLKKENILGSFFNSFLIEVSGAPISKASEDIDFVKLPLLRRKKFCLQTVMFNDSDSRRIVKKAMFPDSEQHLQQMYSYYQKYPEYCGYLNAPVKEYDQALEFDFIKGPSLLDRMLEELAAGSIGAFKKTLEEFCSKLRNGAEKRSDYYTPAFREVFGTSESTEAFLCHPVSNVDMIFPNIILSGKDEYIIDYEWVFDFAVPVDFIIWRSLYMAWMQEEKIHEAFTFEELLNMAAVDIADNALFQSWHDHFNEEYVANHTVEQYFGFQVNSDTMLNNQLNRYNQESVLYADFGNGFTEANTVRQPLKIYDNRFTTRFDLTGLKQKNGGKDPVRLRWDPCSCPAMIGNAGIAETDNDLELVPVNANIDGNDWFFYSDDPLVIINGDFCGLDALVVTGRYVAQTNHIFGEAQKLIDVKLPHTIADLETENRQKTACIEQQQEKITAMEARMSQMEVLLSSFINSKSWKMTAPVRDAMNRLRRKLGK
ncbi:MAG: class I SAM-dependent methyltransferase [Eubacteriaceae bacterium]|jgi:SAM-dependent methyltransferase